MRNVRIGAMQYVRISNNFTKNNKYAKCQDKYAVCEDRYAICQEGYAKCEERVCRM